MASVSIDYPPHHDHPHAPLPHQAHHALQQQQQPNPQHAPVPAVVSSTPMRARSGSNLTPNQQGASSNGNSTGPGGEMVFVPAQPFLTPESYIPSGMNAHTYPIGAYSHGYIGQLQDPTVISPPLSQSPSQPFDASFYPYSSLDLSDAAAAYHLQQSVDHTTPPANQGVLDDDRTPVISDNQPSIPASSLPSANAAAAKPLLSPFKSFNHQHQHPHQHQHHSHQHQHASQPHSMAMYQAIPHATITPGSENSTSPFEQPHQQAYFPPIPQPTQFAYATHVNASNADPAHVSPGMPLPPGWNPSHPIPAGSHPLYQSGQSSQQLYPGQPAAHDFGPDFQKDRSPTSSLNSMHSSLARSASSSADHRSQRPKVKLSREDKRNIVAIHRSNTSLRQEDIARQYGTISKIILSAHRWTAPEEPEMTTVMKPTKNVGGRFPAIEQKMSEWMDRQIASGLDVRDHVARDQAKAFAREIGFPMERFKASAKWLDKFKDRRKMAGKPTTSSMHMYGYYPYAPPPGIMYATQPYPSPIDGPIMLSRSQSAVTLSSSDSSSQELYPPSKSSLPVERMVMAKSEPDLIHYETTPTSRQRSQSSPQVLDIPTMQTPSSGKAVRPSMLSLQRQNSYHGTSTSPRRPATLSRANSSQGSIRRSRPGSLAASAFGITPIGGDEPGYSPLTSPTTSAGDSITHSRQRSDICLTPGFTASMGGMTISPDISDADLSLSTSSTASSSVATMPLAMTVPLTPITPIGPGHGSSAGLMPTPDYNELNEAFIVQHQQQQHYQYLAQHGPPQHPHHAMAYPTMPNKHYQPHQYAPHPQGEFGQVYSQQEQAQW